MYEDLVRDHEAAATSSKQVATHEGCAAAAAVVVEADS